MATELVGACITLYLGFKNLSLTHGQGVVAALGTAVWMVAGLACLTAIYGLIHGSGFWVGAGYASQGLILGLATFVFFADLNSQVSQWQWGMSTVALTFGAIAVVWLWQLRKYLSQFRLGRIPKLAGAAATIVGAVVGLIQGWYQTDYLPRAYWPRVEMSTELVEVGRTASMVHLSAKITLENTGSAEAESIGSIARVVAYPAVDADPNEIPSLGELAGLLDFGGSAKSDDFRMSALDQQRRRLVFANDFMSFRSVLTPGMKVTYQYAVNVDSTRFAVARFSATALLFSGRRTQEYETCSEQPVSSSSQTFESEARRPIRMAGDDFDQLCIDAPIAPRNVVDELVSDRPSIRYHMALDSPPNAGWDTPFVYFEWFTADSPTTWTPQSRAGKFDQTFRNLGLTRSSEVSLIATGPSPADPATTPRSQTSDPPP